MSEVPHFTDTEPPNSESEDVAMTPEERAAILDSIERAAEVLGQIMRMQENLAKYPDSKALNDVYERMMREIRRAHVFVANEIAGNPELPYPPKEGGFSLS